MIRNYLKIALRHLQRNKLYAMVNILGLAIGISSCLLIGLYIWDELRYDRFHKNADRIARVTWHYNFGDANQDVAYTGTKPGPQFQRSFPEVEAFVRTLVYPGVLGYKDKLFEEKKFLFADSTFFSVFSFPLLKGDPLTVLDAPDKVVITSNAARKYFGEEDPVGKTLTIGGTRTLRVSGVAEEAPGHSQIKFDFVAPFSYLNASKTEKWNEANYITFLLLKNGHSFDQLQAKIDQYSSTVLKKEMELTGNSYSQYRLEPLSSVHLHSRLDGFEPNTNILYIYILGAVALLILLIACVNYTNLSTAQSAQRSPEVGIRKVLGAGRGQVFRQFMAEAFLLTLIAMLVALIISASMLPFFNNLAGKSLEGAVLVHPLAITAILFLCLLITFVSGAYPALVLSGSRVIRILKSGFSFTGSGNLRKSLIVVQFVISVFLVVSTIIILQQLSYINSKELGYDKEKILVLPVDRKMQPGYEALKTALINHPSIHSAAGAYEEPTDIGWGDGLQAGSDGSGKSISVNAFPVDQDIVKTLNLQIIAGSDYTPSDLQQLDTSNDGHNLKYSFMLNETAARSLGWTPEEAIGKQVSKGREGRVKAVVKDFHFRSLHESIGPLVIFMDPGMVGRLFVKIKGDLPSAMKHLEGVWKQRVIHRPFEYHFLDEDYAALYKTEKRTAGVFTVFSTIAILLACLGLFALTAYTMVKRTKEIGIRKVLGATVSDILRLVSVDFLKLVMLALVIALPLSYFALNKWLENFAYKVSVQAWVFFMAGVGMILIAFLTISMQALRTAMEKPVKSLRWE
jgi:putative ABC transport system permease protein